MSQIREKKGGVRELTERYADPALALEDLLVVEMGSRIATGVCGCLLAQLGAQIAVVEPCIPSVQWKWGGRAQFTAGKHSVVVDMASSDDQRFLSELISKADIVLLSGDVDPDWKAFAAAHVGRDCVVCDFTAFGSDVLEAGSAATDKEIQALSGVAHTTGFADGPPVVLNVPVMEYSAGAYGASAVLAALKAVEAGGSGQGIDIALYDCAVNSMITFLPAHFGGSEPGRLGNGHSMAVPWNAYQAMDGWALICSATDPQWVRLCHVMGKSEFIEDPSFKELSARVQNRAAADALVGAWVATLDAKTCAEKLSDAGVANGLILKSGDAGADPNLAHRGMIVSVEDQQSGQTVTLAGSVFRTGGGRGYNPSVVPARNAGRDALLETMRTYRDAQCAEKTDAFALPLPLQGIRVVEIGQYTTAPLAGRHLGTLGAEVIKVESPEGDAARAWLPTRHGLSLFFVMSNCGKESVSINLKTEEGYRKFAELIKSADVLVENMKPGSMEGLGLGAAQLYAINPKLVYCQITGFGMDSVYGKKPAYDTVVQAMSGFMDANAFEGVPLKSGISAGDFMGGEVGLFGILAALRQRQRTGLGQYIDLSMQDVAAWMTSFAWDDAAKSGVGTDRLVSCADGYVYAAAAVGRESELAALPPVVELTREAFVRLEQRDGITMTPVCRVSEAVDAKMTSDRRILVEVVNGRGETWPALGSPMRLQQTPPVVQGAIGVPAPL